MQDVKVITIPETAGIVPAVQTKKTAVGELTNKGYDFKRGVGAAFTAALEGSVGGLNWTSIIALSASASGTVPEHYNYVRVNVSVSGAIGTDTLLVVGGARL